MTQHQKIIEMCKDGDWHCQNAFRALYIYSPHKRRSEIEAQGEHKFKSRKCEHGVRGQFDYRMILNPYQSESLPHSEAKTHKLHNCPSWNAFGVYCPDCRQAIELVVREQATNKLF